MVAQPRPAIQAVEDQETKTSDLKWASVVVREIVEKDYRLEASVYDIEGRQARQRTCSGLYSIRRPLPPLHRLAALPARR